MGNRTTRQFRFSDEEWKTVRRLAKGDGTDLSKWVRKRSLTPPESAKIPEAQYRRIIENLGRSGNELNQITRAAHNGQIVELDLKRVLGEIDSLLLELLSISSTD